LLTARPDAIFDRDEGPVDVKSIHPQNITFYQRHGYELPSTIEIDFCPPISPMPRRPRAR
jgi:hypothetical protein